MEAAVVEGSSEGTSSGNSKDPGVGACLGASSGLLYFIFVHLLLFTF